MDEAGLLQRLAIRTEKVVKPLANNATLVSGVLLFLLTLLITVNVFMRYVARMPISWSYELIELGIALVVSLGFAGAATQKINIQLTILSDRLSEGARRKLIAIVELVAFLTCALIAWQSIVFSLSLVDEARRTTMLQLPWWPFVMVLGIGFAITAIVLYKDFLSSLAQALAAPSNRMRDRLWLLIMAVLFFGILSFPFWGAGIVHITPILVGAIGLVFALVLLFARVTVGFTLALVGFLGLVYLKDLVPALGVVSRTPFAWATNYTLTALPLFILMGLLASHSGIVGGLYDTIYKWIGAVKGGLAIATIAACACVGALTGSVGAAAAMMSKTALPEMRRFKYKDTLAVASIAAGGPLAAVIPPSMDFVVYGLLTNTSIGKLFIAGIIPGILNALFFIIAIYVWCRLRPEIGPPGEKTAWKEKFISLKGTGPVLVFFLIIIGGIYMGVFTPIEAGGVAACGLFIYVMVRARKLLKSIMYDSITSTVAMTAMIFLIIIGAMILSLFLGQSGFTLSLNAFVRSLAVPPIYIILAIYMIYIVLGCFMENFSMFLFTVPIFFPIVTALGYDPIWFGVMAVLMVNLALITPPVGMVVYFLSGLSGVPIFTIFRGVLPFIIAQLATIAVLTAWPQIVLVLPNLMRG